MLSKNSVEYHDFFHYIRGLNTELYYNTFTFYNDFTSNNPICYIFTLFQNNTLLVLIKNIAYKSLELLHFDNISKWLLRSLIKFALNPISLALILFKYCIVNLYN